MQYQTMHFQKQVAFLLWHTVTVFYIAAALVANVASHPNRDRDHKVLHYDELTASPRPQLRQFTSLNPRRFSSSRPSLGAGEALSRMLAASNRSQVPCDDFHESVCSGWRRLVEWPSHLPRFGALTWMREMHRNRIVSLLTRPTSDLPRRLQKLESLTIAREMFNKCHAQSFPHPESSPFLHDMIKRWSSVRFSDAGDLAVAVEESIALGGNFLYRATVDASNRNSENMVIWVLQAGLSLGSVKHYSSDTHLEALESLLHRIFADFDIQDVSAKGAVDFERTLARISVDPVTLRDPKLAQEYKSRSPLFPFSAKHTVMVNAPDFFKKLTTLIRSTPPTTLRSYFIGSMMQNILPSYEYPPVHHFRSSLLFVKRPPKDDYCVNALTNLAPFLLAHVQLKDYFPTETQLQLVKRDVYSLIEDIKGKYMDLLSRSKWLSPIMVQRTQRKVSSIRAIIGAEDWIFDEQAVLRFYRDSRIENDWINTMWSWRQVNLRRTWSKLGRPNDRQFMGYPVQANAFYSQCNNRIVIPFGIMFPPIYHVEYPRSIKLAGLGMIIAHEFTHSLDSRGRQYDYHGNLRSWWTRRDQDEYEKRSQCVVDHYANIFVHGQRVDSKLTLAENIADNVAIQVVSEMARESDYRPSLPVEDPTSGQPLDPAKVFFTFMAASWCLHVDPVAEQNAMLRAVHAPNKARINGSFANAPLFHEAYQCPRLPKANMCMLW